MGKYFQLFNETSDRLKGQIAVLKTEKNIMTKDRDSQHIGNNS